MAQDALKEAPIVGEEQAESVVDKELAPAPSSHDKAKKLGFVRFWLVLYGVSVAASLLALMLFAQRAPAISFADLLDYADVVCCGVAVWLIVQRKAAARGFICIFSLSIVVLGILGAVFIDKEPLSLSLIFLDHARLFFLIASAYFFFSRRAKSVLTKGLDNRTYQVASGDEHAIFKPKTRNFWRDVILYFIVFSLVGHWMEIAYSIFARYALGIYDPNAPMWQSLFAPFTIYGIGAVACILVLYPFKMLLDKRIKRGSVALVLSFIANTLLCTGIELAVGLVVNVPDASGHLIYWDYSNIPFNFMGQICLQNSLLFGVVATLMVWAFYPGLERFVLRQKHDGMNITFVVIALIYLLLAAAYIINPELVSIATQF
jgi:uncharacterized membrane protein